MLLRAVNLLPTNLDLACYQCCCAALPDHVHGELTQIRVQLAREPEAAGRAREAGTDQMIKICAIVRF